MATTTVDAAVGARIAHSERDLLRRIIADRTQRLAEASAENDRYVARCCDRLLQNYPLFATPTGRSSGRPRRSVAASGAADQAIAHDVADESGVSVRKTTE